MRALLQPETLRQLVQQPDSLDLGLLLESCKQVLGMQAVIGALRFLWSAWGCALELEDVAAVVLPSIGYHACCTQVKNVKFQGLMLPAGYWFLSTVFKFARAIAATSLLTFVMGIFGAAISGVQWLALVRLWRAVQRLALQDVKFYLNCDVKNKADVVRKGVSKKVTEAFGREMPAVASALGSVAKHAVTNDKFITGFSNGLAENIPEKLKDEAGIVVDVEVKYKQPEGTFCVFLLRVVDIDLRKLLAASQGEATAKKLAEYLDMVPLLKKEFEAFVLFQAAAGLLSNLPKSVAAQMKEVGGIEVEAVGCSQADQSEYFFFKSERVAVGCRAQGWECVGVFGSDVRQVALR
mmetsp:Transcript_32662/g.73202  ORF Transcript_32662/g.73202 Transcript_32662/m.73202 type:complete len:351 (-) Transcript_32662:259-1311(-)